MVNIKFRFYCFFFLKVSENPILIQFLISNKPKIEFLKKDTFNRVKV